MKYEISGTTMQVVEVQLAPGEAVFTEIGGMVWMGENIEMDTNMKGGLFDGLKRKISGESIFMTTYRSKGEGKITFASEYVGRVLPFELGDGQSIICQKDAFLAGQEGVKLEIAFQKKLGAGLFGGEGFIMQKITGPGLVFLELAGEIVEKELTGGEILRVNPGYVAAYEPSVTYDIERIKGIKNMFLGGEGMFLTKVVGPGKVWLQTMPVRSLANALLKYLPIPKQER